LHGIAICCYDFVVDKSGKMRYARKGIGGSNPPASAGTEDSNGKGSENGSFPYRRSFRTEGSESEARNPPASANMKAFIFAAGKGVRLMPLTLSYPKPLIEVAGKPVIHRLFEELPDAISEVVVVIGHKGEMIRNYLGGAFGDKKISYLEIKEQLGTGHVLLGCREYVKNDERFLVIYGDNIYRKNDLERLVANKRAILVRRVPGHRGTGVVTVDSSGRVLKIIEKPDHPISELVVTGAYLLDSNVWNYKPRKRENGEYYINDMLEGLIDNHGVYAEQAEFWMPVGTSEELQNAEKYFDVII